MNEVKHALPVETGGTEITRFNASATCNRRGLIRLAKAKPRARVLPWPGIVCERARPDGPLLLKCFSGRDRPVPQEPNDEPSS